MSENQNIEAVFHPNVKNLAGQKFGYLEVLRKSHKDIHRNIHWWCRCVCGKEKSVCGCALREGKAVSCGCKTGELVSAKKTIHGQTGNRSGTRKITRTYSCWNNMRARCASNETLTARKYAKKDIPMSDDWADYTVFLRDMGECPSDQHSLDRVNNDLGYCKENCRWATHKQQQRNKSSNRIVEFRGKKMCVAEFAEHVGLGYRVVADRIRSGWDLERIAGTPPKKSHKIDVLDWV